MARAQRARPAWSPRGLVVDELCVDGELMVVFSWESTPAAPPVELSDAELDVLGRVVRGQSNADIARARKTSIRTVANQVASLLRKTEAASRFELIRRFAGTTPGTKRRG